MEATIVPEPPEPERAALLAALEGDQEHPYKSAWREAGLAENAEIDEP